MKTPEEIKRFLDSHKSYPDIPTLEKWKADSKIPNSINDPRAQDLALQRIDSLVEALQGKLGGNEKFYLLAELFFSTMWWNNNQKFDPQNMRPERRRTIMSLNMCAANKLARALGCPLNSLAFALQEIYGKEMDKEGFQKDSVGVNAYMNNAQLEKCRILFIHGLAYQIGSNNQKEPFDVRKDYRDASGRAGYIFVMSMSGTLYVKVVTTHSYFLHGRPVLCAGTICATAGQITRLKNDSGHYKPVDTAMVKVIERLRTAGVDISKITIGLEEMAGEMVKVAKEKYRLEPNDLAQIDAGVNAVRFLKHYGNWETILKSGSFGMPT